MSFLFDALYVTAGLLGGPYWLYRLARSPKLRAVLRGKFTPAPQRDSSAPAVWLHCASVGEVLLARGLVAQFGERLPDWDVLISYNTPTAVKTAEEHFACCLRFYCPVDLSWHVEAALDRVKPSLLVLMELELWPNLVLTARERGLPVAVVNGRITQNAARRYGLIGPLLPRVLGAVGLFAMQSPVYAERIIGLGADPAKVHVIHSMKYDNVSTDERPDEALARTLGIDASARVIVGGCTYEGEDEALIDIYRTLRANYDDLRLILAPRHPERLPAVEGAITAAGLRCVRRSTLSPDGPATGEANGAVILIDTVGELDRIYSLASVAFVGGSLIPRGGHNMMEPAGRGKPVFVGPHTANFAEAVADLVRADGLKVVADAGELRRRIEALIADLAQAQAMGARARRAIIERQGATKATFDLLRDLAAPRL